MKIQYVIRWLTKFYDFRFKETATAGTGIHLTKAWLSQLVNFKNAIWTLEERYAIKFCFKLWSMLALPDRRRPNPPTNFWWSLFWQHWHDLHALGSPGQTVNKEYYVEVLREFRERFLGKRPALFKSGRRHFHQDNAPVHNSILVTDYLTTMGIKTVPQPSYSPDLAPWDFWLFPKLRGCRYETIEEMKEAVTKVIDTLTQEDIHGVFQKLLER